MFTRYDREIEGIVYHDDGTWQHRAEHDAGVAGGAKPTPTPRPEEGLSEKDLTLLYWAGAISKEQYVAELMARGRTQAVAERGVALNAGATKSKSDLAKIEAIKAELARTPPATAPAASPSPVAAALASEDQFLDALRGAGALPAAVSIGAATYYSEPAAAAAAAPVNLQQQAFEALQERYGQQIRNVRVDSRGNATGFDFYDPQTEQQAGVTFRDGQWQITGVPRTLSRTEGVSPVQRILGMKTASQRTTKIPLGGPMGETARPSTFSNIPFGGKNLPLFNLPFIPRGGFQGVAGDPNSGGLQSEFRRMLLGGQAGLIPTNVGPEGAVMARGLDTAGNEIGFGVQGLGSDPFAFGTGNKGQPLLKAPSSPQDAARRALVLQDLQARLGPERAADPAFYLRAAEEAGLLAGSRGSSTGLWQNLDPVARYEASVGLGAATENATEADRLRYTDLLNRPGIWDAQDAIAAQQGIPGATYDPYGRLTYDPSTDTSYGFSGPPLGFAGGGTLRVGDDQRPATSNQQPVRRAPEPVGITGLLTGRPYGVAGERGEEDVTIQPKGGGGGVPQARPPATPFAQLVERVMATLQNPRRRAPALRFTPGAGF